MSRRRHDGDALVYSTESGAVRPALESKPKVASGDTVRIWLEKKGRNGTPVSIVRGLPPDRERLTALAARLKRACGSGGSAKDGEIIIQGDHRERIATLLAGEGVRVKLAGG